MARYLLLRRSATPTYRAGPLRCYPSPSERLSRPSWSRGQSEACHGFKGQAKRGPWKDAFSSIVVHEGQPNQILKHLILSGAHRMENCWVTIGVTRATTGKTENPHLALAFGGQRAGLLHQLHG